jgi:hypothetical protein
MVDIAGGRKNCTEVKELLSAYHDGELTPDMHDAVALHLECCPICAAMLRSFQQLSDLSGQLTQQEAPNQWTAIEEQLATVSAPSQRKREWLFPSSPYRQADAERRRFPSRKLLAIAAMVLVALGLIAYLRWPLNADRHDRHLAATFNDFLNQFDDNPQVAQQVLLASYEGDAVDLPTAAKTLGYQPAVARGLPPGYTIDSVYVLNMPCCKCPQTICRREGGGQIAVFEHEVDQPAWFGDRPAVEARCCGKPTRIVEVNNLLAATWRSNDRYMTVIGAQDVEELAKIVSHFEGHEQTL